ncbi:MAG: serine--tRNA ligase [bacterium]
MLDIQYIRDNKELVQEKASQKGYPINLDELLNLDNELRHNIQILEDLLNQRNVLSAQFSNNRPSEDDIEKGKELKNKSAEIEKTVNDLKKKFTDTIKKVPNMPLEMVPVGLSENDNVIYKKVGEPLNYDFAPKNHWELNEANSLIDKTRAAKVAGSRFVYLKGGLVRLQFAIINWVMDKLTDEAFIAGLIKDNNLNISTKAFVPILPPGLVNTSSYMATTRLDAEEVTYKLADDEMWMNASAEHSLCNMYQDEILASQELPIRYLGYATSYRREAGSYGKDTEGIIRLHQFDKLEMEVFSTPETGLDEHKLLVAIEEYFVSQLELPYQLLEKCTADIGKPNAKGMDIEIWFPGQNKYRETHSADYMTDFQARSLKTRFRKEDNSIDFVHNNDATVFAFSRILAALMENYQTKEGQIKVPEVLKNYLGGMEKI